MMLCTQRIKSPVLLMQTVLIILCIVFSTSVSSVAAKDVQSPHPAADSFGVPVKIETYGNAWEGYLAFGLWDFAYGPTNFSLTPADPHTH